MGLLHRCGRIATTSSSFGFRRTFTIQTQNSSGWLNYYRRVKEWSRGLATKGKFLIISAVIQRGWVLTVVAAVLIQGKIYGQLDPEKRRLIQLGYNQPLEGRAPISGYGFFYYNNPDFINTNMVLRLAIAPVYVDSELGFKGLITPNTDVAI